MLEMMGIEERKKRQLLRESAKYVGIMFLTGIASGSVVIGIFLIWCRMAGPLL